MNEMRIAMVGQKRVPSREGGIEIVVEELSTRMAAQGHDVVLFNRGGHHVSGKKYDNKREKNYRGVTLKTVPTLDMKGLAAVTSSFFCAIRAAFGPYDVVHFHAEGPCAFIGIPKLLKRNALLQFMVWIGKEKNGMVDLGVGLFILEKKQAVKYADEIIVLSRGTQNYFKSVYGRNTVLISNGVNKPNITQAELITEKWGLKRDDYILFLGRIVPEKGIKYLVEAYQKLHTDKKLVIAGGASDTDDFVKELKENCGDNVIFTGFVTGKILDELYSNCYIYCLPSDLEGMPISLLEAMSYGDCCVVSDIDECASVVENNAVIIKKGNVEDLRDKLQNLCDSPEIVEQYKSKASDYILKKYRWDDVVEQTLMEYRS